MLKSVLCVLVLLISAPLLRAQKVYGATRKLNVQVGLAGSAYTLDYGDGYEQGFTIYGDADLGRHFGLEALYRNASIRTPADIGENHALIGPRVHITRGRFSPYAKVLGGIGIINFQQGYNVVAHSDSYFIFAFGGGVDFRLTNHLNIRPIEYEYQIWPTFMPHGLTPTGFSAGLAYNF